MPTQDRRVEKTRAVIRALLALIGRRVRRTALVKLVYLADNRFCDATARTITGNGYMWDHYGPNAIGHAIVNEANELARLCQIRMAEYPSMYGGFAFEYWVDDVQGSWDMACSVLDEGERQVLMDVAKQFGHANMASLINVSKKTRPFAQARQYDVLQLEQDPHARDMRELLNSSGRFLEDLALGFQEADEGQWILDSDLDRLIKS